MTSAPSFALVCPNFHPITCGVGDHSFRFGQELRRRGYRAEIFTRAPVAPHPEDGAVPVHGVEPGVATLVAARIHRAVIAGGFTHLILQYTPHMWGAWRFGSVATALLAAASRRSGLDVTLVAHELFTPFLSRPDLLAGAALHRLQILAVAAGADRTFVTTDTRLHELLPLWRAVRLGGRPGVLRISPNALPVARTRELGRSRLGVFSTLATTKRFDVVLGAFEYVWRHRPESELVLIGDIGPRSDSRVNAIHDLVKQHPARDRIRVTGKLSLSQVAREMASLDVYLFPMTTGANTRSGTLPLALGCGLPVVAVVGKETDLQLFKDGENVLFAPAMTGDAYGAAALRVLDDLALERRLSSGARRLHDEHLSWIRVVDGFLADIGQPSERVQARA